MKKISLIAHLSIFIILTFVAFIIHIDSENNFQKDLTFHTQALEASAWDFNYHEIENYLLLVAYSQKYYKISYFDFISDTIQVSVFGPPMNSLNNLLVEIGIMKTSTIRKDVIRAEDILGYIEITKYNWYLYIYIYVFLIQLLFQYIAFLLINLNQTKVLLEVRVKERTFELEQEVSFRKEAEDNLRLTLDSINDGVITTDKNGYITQMNPIAQSLLELSSIQAEGQNFCDVFAIRDELTEEIVECPIKEVLNNYEVSGALHFRILISKKGHKYKITESCSLLKTPEGDITGLVVVFRDVTEIVKLRSQLEHNLRMDAIGQLAGGIAHDFNNMLGGILGSSELLQTYITGNEKAEKMNKMIVDICKRSSGLTQQLLAFSRKQNIAFSSMDLNKIIEFSTTLLKRTIDRKIEIQTKLSADDSVIVGDATMMESVIINIGINASHAMPSGGKLSFETKNKVLDQKYCTNSPFDLNSGRYLEVVIEDNGHGMSRETLSHIFEPFYTTKIKRKGVGLGLSAVYGIIKQHKGEIRVYSEVNKGTSFLLLLPLSNMGYDKISQKDFAPKNASKKSKILFADDEEIIRLTGKEILESLGYSVLTAKNGQEAFNYFQKDSKAIDLVILDMIMPVMNGRESFEKMKEISPDIPVILASGFSKSEDVQSMINQGLCHFISKPYTMIELSNLIYKLLNSE